MLQRLQLFKKSTRDDLHEMVLECGTVEDAVVLDRQ